ncbi:MAG: hypothetical protein KGJ78_16235 [Alphaproteobacteria bacterium]|nr:hypothetical protein [Alphaproteobacteria bacterium]
MVTEAPLLAGFQARLKAEDDARKRAMRRGYAAAGVAFLHFVFLFVLIKSEWMPAKPKVHPQEALTWLELQPPAAKRQAITPVNPRNTVPQWASPAIELPRILKKPEENNAIDLGLALGQSLACGANSFEYLTPAQRMACKHQPWHFVYDKDGYIVLDASPRPEIAQERPRPSDVQAHERNTADPCLIAKQSGTECIDKMLFGDHR